MIPTEKAILNQWSGSRWTPSKTGSFKNGVFWVKYHIKDKIQIRCNPKLTPLLEPITTGISMVFHIKCTKHDSSKAIFQHIQYIMMM
jgi:hypothetical protein